MFKSGKTYSFIAWSGPGKYACAKGVRSGAYRKVRGHETRSTHTFKTFKTKPKRIDE